MKKVRELLTRVGEVLTGVVARYQFASMILIALIIAGALISVSIYIYIASGAINIDLSRPGYESIRDDTVAQPEAEPPFPSTGEIDEAVRADFLRRLNIYQAGLQQMNDFGGDSLSDESLNLVE